MANYAKVEAQVQETGSDKPQEETAPQENSSTAASSSPSPGVEPDSGERPSWLPEKFKSPEDLAKAYSELEKSRGKPQEPELPKLEGKRDAVVTAEELQTYSQQYAEKGELGEDVYKALEAKGIPKAIVDDYIQGQIAKAHSHRIAVFEVAGGEQGYMDLIAWGNQNLSKEEAAVIDSAIQSGDFNATKTALKGLMAQRAQAEGILPNQVQGRVGATGSLKPFGSLQEQSRAQRDPRYKLEEAYRREVEARIAISDY